MVSPALGIGGEVKIEDVVLSLKRLTVCLESYIIHTS
jgi:hypothetical protein